MAYPIFGKISDKVYNNIQTSGKGATGGNVDITVASSELVCWVRLISATDLTPATSGSNYGLIMDSNPLIDTFSSYDSLKYNSSNNLESVEQTPSQYGGKFSSGMLGLSFSGKGVYPYLTPVTGDLVLRPRPLVTSLQIKEGKDQISRHCDLTIKCFSLAQAEMLQEYLMEPGHTLFIEYGWNTRTGLNEMIDISNHRRLVQLATDIGLDYGKLQVKRENSYGDYDAFYGFIVGGSLTSENENFILTVKLRGAPGLPVFLQGQHTILEVDSAAKKISNVPSSQTYSINDITTGDGGDASETIDVKMGGRRWKWMFNKLIGNRQTPEVKKIIEEVYKFQRYGYWDFINFDYRVAQDMASQLAGNYVTSLKDFFGQKEFDVGGLTVPKEKLVSENRYIRFSSAIDILNANSGLYAYKIGSKSVTCRINNYGFIGAFPNMFSTRPDKLIIPGKMPNFYQYYCNPSPVTIEQIIEGSYIDNSVPQNAYNSTSKKWETVWQSFVQTDDLPTGTVDNFYNGYYEKGGYYGKLENLYINFNVFINALKNSSNKSLRDVLIQMCNEMSSAVNSFWNLQILEIPYEDGIKLQIVDENWRGYLNNKKSTVKPFIHSGEQSIFLEASLDIDIPSEMTNQIILKRENYTSNPDSQPLQMGGLFGNSKDRFFDEVDYRKTSLTTKGKAPKGPSQPTRDAAAVQKDIDALIASLTRKIIPIQGIVILYSYVDSNGDEVYSETYTGPIRTDASPKAGTAVGDKLIELKKELDKVSTEEKTTAETALGTNLAKIDIVPNPIVNKINAETLQPSAGFTEFNKNYKIYCLEDAQIFDIMRNNAFEQYSGIEKTSHPLPIKYSFKVLGKSGLRRGDTFNVIGIPKKYRDYGFFQITEITQTLEGNTWYTDVVGQYFQQIKVN